MPVGETIVSDDSTDDRTYQLVSSEFPDVKYLRGPRKGIGANRNNAVRIASLEYVSFLDDDGRLGSSFLENVRSCLARSENPQRTIVTGPTLDTKEGKSYLVYPHEQDFLGFQSLDYKKGQPINTIVLNSVLFPRSLFDELHFDESLNTNEEVDLATRARARGYNIVLCEPAVNLHRSTPLADRDYPLLDDASRIYVTYKRYAYSEKNPTKGIVYLLAAVVHLFLSAGKRRGFAGVLEAAHSVKMSSGYIRGFIRSSNKRRSE